MRRIVINLLISAVVAFILQKLLRGVHFADFGTAVIFSIVLSLLNVFVKPVLNLFSLPFTIFTLGLFSLVINAVVVLMVEYFVEGVFIDSFFWALIFSVLLSVSNSLLTIGKD